MDSTSLTLLERLCTGRDDAGWQRFVEIYAPLLQMWARRAGLSDADAADVVQDVLMTVMNEMPHFAYDSKRRNFRGWLKTITVNRSRTLYRKKAPVNAVNVDQAVFECLPGSAADEFWEREYQQHLVRRALQVMQRDFETNTWRACWETTINDRPAKEVALELGMSEAAIYVAKSRVLRRLREELRYLWD
ncbi:MAG TPA: sigma-70 family RNA polymerase sigma factor [Pirellulales bacterium]|jgi:RNA polymerase sigma-70 factor (ECF subfamily)|nr:sigma-70 family RNA polymerase sigma factor [Pirellulales bacterium]